MKKFTKGCLITALVLFIFGCAFFAICGYMGGFRQLDNMNLDRGNILSIGWHGIRLGYNGGWFGISDDDWDGWEDSWRSDDFGTPNLVEVGEQVQTNYDASAVTNIDIELGGANLVIEESKDDYIWIANNSSEKTVKYALKNGVFTLYYGRTVRFWQNISDNNNGTIHLYLPKDLNLDSIDLEMAAGNMDSIALAANEIDIEVGAGNFKMKGLTANEIDIRVGAGNAHIQDLHARDVSAECGAGEINIEKCSVNVISLDTGVGNMDIKGTVTVAADIKCGMGNIDLTLQGTQQDYDYDLECSLGNIVIGGDRYSGIAKDRSIRNGSDRIIDAECSAGNITINFEK